MEILLVSSPNSTTVGIRRTLLMLEILLRRFFLQLNLSDHRTANNVADLQTPQSPNPVPPSCIPVPTIKVPVPTGSLPVPTGSIPVPTGSIPVPAATGMVPTDDVLVHTSSSTDSIFDGEPTTRFPCSSNFVNHNPSPGIFSSSLYDDEFDTALNNVASSVEVSPVATKRIITIHPQSLIIGDPTSAMQTRSKMDVKSVFLYGRIDEKVYVTQPKGFVDPQYPKKVYKVVKALYGLHQALRACQCVFKASSHSYYLQFGSSEEDFNTPKITTMQQNTTWGATS
nr:reverse transcriptase [Tanacetum cinerariifolium]